MCPRKFRPLLIVAVCCWLSGGRGQTVSAAPELEQILAGIDTYFEKLQSLEAGFTQVVEAPALEKSEQFRGRLYFRKPEYLRLEYTVPEGQLLVADGDWYWFFMPQPDLLQAMRAPMDEDEGAGAPRYILGGDMHRRFTGKLLGEEQRNGKPCYLLELFPLKTNRYYRSLKAWIDVSSYATLAVRYQDLGGTLNYFEFSDLAENIRIDPQKFIFVPPPGTQVLDEY
ncbi:MAG: outer membrane lipoprotein carrier protein LolA [Candidatus Glassbacteria bacterium]|nr:outer membrane lipoprotein carrier protein LolA [Candidatus Glassbacteria bacterium]